MKSIYSFLSLKKTRWHNNHLLKDKSCDVIQEDQQGKNLTDTKEDRLKSTDWAINSTVQICINIGLKEKIYKLERT